MIKKCAVRMTLQTFVYQMRFYQRAFEHNFNGPLDNHIGSISKRVVTETPLLSSLSQNISDRQLLGTSSSPFLPLTRRNWVRLMKFEL